MNATSLWEPLAFKWKITKQMMNKKSIDAKHQMASKQKMQQVTSDELVDL
jgi:hypothetical protein